MDDQYQSRLQGDGRYNQGDRRSRIIVPSKPIEGREGIREIIQRATAMRRGRKRRRINEVKGTCSFPEAIDTSKRIPRKKRGRRSIMVCMRERKLWQQWDVLQRGCGYTIPQLTNASIGSGQRCKGRATRREGPENKRKGGQASRNREAAKSSNRLVYV